MGLFRRKASAANSGRGNTKPEGTLKLTVAPEVSAGLRSVDEGAAVQLLDTALIARVMTAKGGAGAARVDGVVVALQPNHAAGVDVMLDGHRAGSMPASRVGEFIALIEGAARESAPAWVLAHVTHSTEWRLYIERRNPDAARAAATKSKRAQVKADALEAAKQTSDIWVVSIGGDESDMLDDFDPEAFRKRILRAAKTGATIRMEWDEDWIETYPVTSDLVVEMYCERGDGTISDIERINGPTGT
jgi:hypothetical protein